MDPSTVQFYSANAATLADRYSSAESTAARYFAQAFLPASRRARATRPAGRPPGASPAPDAAASEPPLLILFDPPEAERFVTCVPLFELEAAAGAFGPEQPEVDPAEQHTWLPVSGRRLTRDMFALRVVGRSMEPLIRDGDYCLFRGGEALAGSRHGRFVLVCLREGADPDTGGKLTVKRYSSVKTGNDDTEFRHVRIELQPLNPDYAPIVIERADEGALRVVGEFVAVIQPQPATGGL